MSQQRFQAQMKQFMSMPGMSGAKDDQKDNKKDKKETDKE